MKTPEIPLNEKERLNALKEYSILDTLPEKEFDDITKIASAICQTPMSLITLIDSNRQWFKSSYGLDAAETPRDISFCAHAIVNSANVFIVNDTREDIRFKDNPFVTNPPNVIFYAGVPLINSDGFALGTLCVADNKPRELTDNQREALQSLSNQVVKLFELKKANKLLNEIQNELKTRNIDLEKFAYVVCHDIRSPLNNIMGLSSILKVNQKEKLNEEGKELLDYLVSSSVQLKNLVEGIINHYMEINKPIQDKNEIDLNILFKDLIELLDPKKEYNITYTPKQTIIQANEIALKQILLNLINNAIKYNDKAKVDINIDFWSDDELYFFSVKDNGYGIENNQLSKIFETFVTLGTKDRFNNSGTGIGLSTVKKLVEKLGGTIDVTSEVGIGSEFKFSIKK